MDVRTQLAVSPNVRVEIGRDGVLHVLTGPMTLHVDRRVCRELAVTLGRALDALDRAPAPGEPPCLRVVASQTTRTEE